MEKSPKRLTLCKTLFCSPQLVATFIRYQDKAHIAVCQPGAAAWWLEYVHCFSPFVDMVFHQGKLYVLEPSKDTLFAINISVDQETGDPWVSRVRQIIKGRQYSSMHDFIMKMSHLVTSNGALLMVHRKMYCVCINRHGTARVVPSGANKFEVFKADIERSQWIKVITIGDDQVLFLRRPCSRIFCVSQTDMPGDRIVFFENDDDDRYWYEKDSLNSCSAYDMKGCKVSAAPPLVSWKRGHVHAAWLFPEE
ncbi:hypothetical protein QOZ80_9BG0716720 [Eleusine coracana subsp. coracana]|nr:hypothetical protein QOZ80_9BG0716720 [Eleusine coracana subsp. coracana]